MGTTTRTRLIRIGNSQGVRLPKLLIEQAGLIDEIEIEMQAGQLVLRPAHSPRHNWKAAFEEMAKNGDDRLLDEESHVLTEWEEREWEW